MSAAEPIEYQQVLQYMKPVVCECGHRICDSDGVIRSRCVKVPEGVALCRCKRWVKVPIGRWDK